MVREEHQIDHYLRHKKNFPASGAPVAASASCCASSGPSIRSGWTRTMWPWFRGSAAAGRMSVYVDFNTMHTTHGRALAFATGLKLPARLYVLVVMGDGDALAIGGNHFIHAARRNIGFTAIVVNNSIYGMTGGQYSPSTPMGRAGSHSALWQYRTALFPSAIWRLPLGQRWWPAARCSMLASSIGSSSRASARRVSA